MKKVLYLILLIILILFGAFLVVYGERDDSPGAQGLGLLAAITGIIFFIRNRKVRV